MTVSNQEPKRLKVYINGKWLDSSTQKWLEVRNPATDQVIALCPEVTKEEIDQAVRAAQEAFWAWRMTPPPRRAKLLFQFHRKLQEHQEELARLIVDEHGKTLSDAMGELTRSFEYVEHACAGPELLKGSHAEHVGSGVDTVYIREPLGAFVFLPPFNFPAMIALYFVWAIAAGNTAIIKASRLCPMTAVRIVELAHECRLPQRRHKPADRLRQRSGQRPGGAPWHSGCDLCGLFQGWGGSLQDGHTSREKGPVPGRRQESRAHSQGCVPGRGDPQCGCLLFRPRG